MYHYKYAYLVINQKQNRSVMYMKIQEMRYVFMPPKAYKNTIINQTMTVLPTDGIRLLTVATFYIALFLNKMNT